MSELEKPEGQRGITRRRFLFAASLLFLSGCYEAPRRNNYPSPRSSYPTPENTPVASPLLLAYTETEPLSSYLKDIQMTALNLINPGYFEQGVQLSHPAHPNFGLDIKERDLIDDKIFTRVRTIIQTGRAGRQPFLIENRYAPDTNKLLQKKVTTGASEDRPFIRTDLIPEQPLGDKRDLDSIKRADMILLPFYIFRFSPTTRWEEPNWVGPLYSEEKDMQRRGADNQGIGFVVKVLHKVGASLLVG